MDIVEALLDSWDRQCRIVEAVASRIDESNRHLKPSEDGWPLDYQLAHIHQVRRFFLDMTGPEYAEGLGRVFTNGWDDPIGDLNTIKTEVAKSSKAVRDAVEKLCEKGMVKAGPYDNPVLLLQHMVWHEGWHIGLIFLALRLGGQEPPQMWEEQNVWDLWRTEE